MQAKRKARGVAAVGLAIWLTGCSGYSIQENGAGPGYDVYAPEPYLLRQPVVAGSPGAIAGFKFQLTWLPNYSKRYRVRSWPGIGKADFEFTFEEGWKLTRVADKEDNSAAVASLVDLAKQVIPAAGAARSAVEPGAPDKDLIASSAFPVLYRIDFEDGRPVRLQQVSEGK